MKLNQTISTKNHLSKELVRPNPPTPEMVKRAQFIDKTYQWKHADIRPGN